MRLSVVFELLLVFLFLAFAAARVIDPTKRIQNVAKGNKKTTTLRQGPPNRYCACTSRMCNCCRDFSLPVVPIKGPGCASIMYVQRDTMMVTMSFGDRVLSNTTISGKTPKPICMALPGGISQFCGRVYGISRKGDQFRACLGLELRALDDIEAALRVSCFKFGPKGVKLESAPPVPVETGGKDPEEDDEDDYDLDDDEDDDLIGFGVDDEDDGASNEDNEVDSDSVDYTGFSVLGEDILGTLFSDDSGSNTKKKKPSKKTAKPQVVAPKVSTTTRRPILPNRRRSTTKPLSSVTVRPLPSATVKPLSSPTIRPLSSATVKPLSSLTARPLSSVTLKPLSSLTARPVINRVTKKPALNTRPQIVQKPSAPTIAAPSQTVFLPISSTIMTHDDLNEHTVTKIATPTTTTATTTTTTTTETPLTTLKTITMHSEQNKEVHMTEEGTTLVTEEPITFTIPTHGTEIVKNDIKLPLTDLDKFEAVAAIAQQDVTSGVISSSSLTSGETKKPLEIVTVNYEKITPVYHTEATPSSLSENKMSSIKFISTTIVTSRPNTGLQDDSLDQTAEGEISENLQQEIVGIKSKITEQQSTVSTPEKNKVAEHNKVTEESNTKGNLTVSLKNQTSKKPENEKEEEDEEEEEEEEEEAEEEDLLEGVLGEDDDTDNEGAEEEEDNSTSQSNKNEEASDGAEEGEEEEENEESDVSGEAVGTGQKVKPTKVSIKKKPTSNDSINEEEEEEEEEEEDILDVLADDDEEEESDDEENDETEKEKNKKKPTMQVTTIKIKKPTTQQALQTRKPVTTEKLSPSTTQTTEKVTEKIFIYKEPAEKVTEKVIFYEEPENKIPNKIFVFKEPENQISQKTTEKIIFYKEPSEQMFADKFVIYKEPEEKVTEKPAVLVMQENIKSSEETKDDSEEEDRIESEDENASEEETENDDSAKHTLIASIVKPEFSNKYAEEHDLTESDDLDIEDPEDDGTDFEEDRKMKETRKRLSAKSPPVKKSEVQVSKSKVLTLTDLIGQRKKFYDHSKDDKPISTSRTHRRMNLDRLLQV